MIVSQRATTYGFPPSFSNTHRLNNAVVSAKPPLFRGEQSLPSLFPNQCVSPKHADANGYATGQFMLSLIDAAGGYLVRRFNQNKPVVTASFDRIQFHEPAKLFDYLSTQAKVTATGTYSINAQVTLTAHRIINLVDHVIPVATADLVFVAIGKNRQPVVKLSPQTPNFNQNAGIARLRKTIREAEKAKVQAVASPEAIRVTRDEALRDTRYVYRTSLQDSNYQGKVFGGIILGANEAPGAKAAQAFAKAPVRLLRQDRMNFIKSGEIGDVLIGRATIVRTWNNRLIDVQSDLYARTPKRFRWMEKLSFLPKNPERLLATSYLTYEPIDKMARVPDVTPHTPKQKLRWEIAGIRRNMLLEEQAALSKL